MENAAGQIACRFYWIPGVRFSTRSPRTGFRSSSAASPWAAAQYRLAQAHSKGTGTEQDPLVAYIWASLSAHHGNNEASALRERVLSRLTPEEIAEADRLVEARIARDAAEGSS